MNFPRQIKYILKVFFTGLLFFTSFRFLLVITEYERLNTIDSGNTVSLLFQAFVMGIRFDTTISSYILALPLIFLLVGLYFKNFSKVLIKGIYFYIGIFYSLAFFICAADIPYFNQFFSRLTISALTWMDHPEFVFQMVIQEVKYWWILIPFVLTVWLFWKMLKSYTNEFTDNTTQKLSLTKNIIITLLTAAVTFLGIRGRIDEKSPILVGTAYFSNNAFINQIGLNPNFTFLNSYFDSINPNNKNVNFMENESAINFVRTELNITDSLTSPVARKIPGRESYKKHNVVLVIMESMSFAKMNYFNKTKNLTPFLDSLSQNSYFFENVFTAGTHTYNGVFSSLFSFPAVLKKHPMRQVEIQKYNGFAETLKQHDYSTIYFTTHDDQFDNVGGFLKSNSFDKIVSKEDYPSDEILSTLGVPDDYMFRFSMDYLNKLNEKEKPFFAAFMTASDHGPYIVPEYFKPKTEHIKDQIVEYADWSLSRLIELSKNQKWFDNTIFVFIADHGGAINVKYDIPLNYFRTPLVFYAPNILKEPKTFSKLGGQIDVFPTTMGIIGAPYINNTLGIDLVKEKRSAIFFNQDEKYAAVNGKYLMVAGIKGKEGLYNYTNGDTKNIIKNYPEIYDSLKHYAEAMYQTTQYLNQKKATFIK